MKKIILFSINSFFVVIITSSLVFSSVEVYPGPGNDKYKSTRYSVEIDNGNGWESSFTYKFTDKSITSWHRNSHPCMNFTTFGTTGPVKVQISFLKGQIETIEVSPKSKKIPVSLSNGKAILTLNKNDKTWIIINKDDINPLFVFADEPKPEIPKGATYFGPGITDMPGTDHHYKPKSDEVIYLDGGAWVKGNIDVRNTKNVKIMGPGVLSGELWNGETGWRLPFEEKKPYFMIRGDWSGDGCVIEGITIIDAPSYNINYAYSAYSVKLLCPWYYSTDGFYVNHTDQCFGFVGDNLFFPGEVVGDMTVSNSFGGNTNNAVFCGGYWGLPAGTKWTSLVTNVDIKTYADTQSPVVFQIWMDNADSSKGFSNQTYKDIRIEGNIQNEIAGIQNKVYPWEGGNHPNPPLGNSYNLVFENITLEGTQAKKSLILGCNKDNGFHNITFNNLIINNTLVTEENKNNYFDINEFVWDLKFKATKN